MSGWTTWSDQRGFSLALPDTWGTGEQVEGSGRLGAGATLIAAAPESDLLFELYVLKANPLKLYADLYQENALRHHVQVRVMGTGVYELDSGHRCLRLTLTGIERTVDGEGAEFTTDYYLVDAGPRVLSLNFKVLTPRYAQREGLFSQIVDSLALDGE
ncbi:MAG: hypothetical protein HY554_09185 [Elusimicrobia bacterium]|nr:hypothetical protein [Elusimicrobiota bacterium]